jgi:S-DNA-T family DNA segregation ATPase FtsK/SpoIIIE
MNPPHPDHHRTNAPHPQDAPPTPTTEHTTGPAPVGTLIRFPVLEGEIVRERVVARLRARVVTFARAVASSPQAVQLKAATAYRARQAPHDLLRLVWFFLRGQARWVVKGWCWITHGDLRADARAARLGGDSEARRTAQEAIRADGHARWARLGNAARLGLTLGLLIAFLAGLLTLIDAQVPRAQMWPWLASLYTVLGVLAVLGVWLLKVAPVGWVIAAVWEGRDRTPGAGWLIRPSREDADSWVDERMISRALAHLGISPLDRFFKEGGELVYTVPARVDGDGTYAQIRLPLGVEADMVAARRKRLAANLSRAALETWPTEGNEAGILDLWIADKGRLGKSAGPWPLLHEGNVDVFTGVPIGKTQRGLVIHGLFFERNWLVGGRPGQGKTSLVRILVLGAGLDPTAEIWVFVIAQNTDFEPCKPRLSRYAVGMGPEIAAGAVQALADLLTEMERRGKLLATLPGSPPATSRRLADKPRLGLHPLICVISECHELFGHPTYGTQAAKLAISVIKQGRKFGITLILDTQSPTAASIPTDVTRHVSCGVAFSVADHDANDGLLGSGKYRAGIRATELRMNTDRGTCVAVGVSDATFELLNTFHVPYADGIDLVSPVVARAMAAINDLRRTGQPTTHHDDQDHNEPGEIDHLTNIHQALRGERRVRTQVVLSRLAELDPATYEGWSFHDLTTTLARHGIKPVKSRGVKSVRAADITHALTHRAHHNITNSDQERGT